MGRVALMGHKHSSANKHSSVAYSVWLEVSLGKGNAVSLSKLHLVGCVDISDLLPAGNTNQRRVLSTVPQLFWISGIFFLFF